ncbi:unnamed protein product [Moneuplotes crassus]|uniref:Uncharacterized protein n=1 Tax=Euplotes crassus TaxID=5936 RepID=A0AAD1UTJ5_EUPCR|nr:unnamed protein product [Moneuplotes crassus]
MSFTRTEKNPSARIALFDSRKFSQIGIDPSTTYGSKLDRSCQIQTRSRQNNSQSSLQKSFESFKIRPRICDFAIKEAGLRKSQKFFRSPEKAPKVFDKDIGINSKFSRNAYRLIDLKTQKSLIKSLHKINSKFKRPMKRKESQKVYPRVLAKSEAVPRQFPNSVSRNSTLPRPLTDLKSIKMPKLNYSPSKGYSVSNHAKDWDSRSFNNISCRKSNKSQEKSSKLKRNTSLASKMDSVVRIGKRRKPLQVFKVHDECRYPPTEEQKKAFKLTLKQEAKDNVYKKAIERLVKQAYYNKSVGSIPRGKSCRIDHVLSLIKK